MMSSRERALRDREWELESARREGFLKGEIKWKIELIRLLQEVLHAPISDENELEAMRPDQLEAMMNDFCEKYRSRRPAHLVDPQPASPANS
jgi:hypothetical protein